MSTAAVLAREVVLVRGADAASFLQGQLSQDLDALGIGDAAFSLLLQPAGKVDAFLRVTRVEDQAFALDVDAGWGEHVRARLQRFLLRVKVELEVVDWPVIAVLDGDGAATPVPPDAWRVPPELGGAGYDVLGPGARVPRGSVVLDAAEYDARRIRAGVPRMGAELDASTIPASAGVVERAVSFTKGCYTGQELVARIDSRGDKVPTRLRHVRGHVAVGATLLLGDREVGRVTSAVGDEALAYVRREVEPPAVLAARWEGGEAEVRVEGLGA
jgi:folate-binding protein YgfZ